MCGFIGFLDENGTGSENGTENKNKIIKSMNDKIIHREIGRAHV